MDERKSTNFAFTIHTPRKGEGDVVRSTVSDVYILDRLLSGEVAATARHAAALGPLAPVRYPYKFSGSAIESKLECQRIESRCNTLNNN